jgi:hypothetical protein
LTGTAPCVTDSYLATPPEAAGIPVVIEKHLISSSSTPNTTLMNFSFDYLLDNISACKTTGERYQPLDMAGTVRTTCTA